MLATLGADLRRDGVCTGEGAICVVETELTMGHASYDLELWPKIAFSNLCRDKGWTGEMDGDGYDGDGE